MKNKLSNNRGEVLTIVLVSVAVLLLAAPKLNPINWITGSGTSTAPTEKSKYDRKKILSEPILLTKGDHVAVGQRYEEVYEKGEDMRERKLTITERIGGFFTSLTTAGFAFVIISLLFFGGAPIVWIANKYFKMKGALVATVKGIKEVKVKDAQLYESIVKPSLLTKQDAAHSAIIDKLKTKIK